MPRYQALHPTGAALLDNLRDALQVALGMNRADMRAAVGGFYAEVNLSA